MDSAQGMIRAGFLSREERAELIDLARDGSITHRLARRANAVLRLDESDTNKLSSAPPICSPLWLYGIHASRKPKRLRTLLPFKELELGSTLIEALVALAVAAAALAAIGELGFTTIAAARRVETRLFLASSAREAFTALLQLHVTDEGRLRGEINGAMWQLQSTPFPFDPVGPLLAWSPHELRLVVTRPTGGKIVIETVRLRPRGASE
jgi:hypothetical protein